MLNYKTNVHIDRQAQPRKPGFLSRLRRGKTLVTAGHVTLENPQNLGKN
jgi:CRISPR/Cas system CSM-associated protein Csm3 (group 7 of RAMP superfamily)